MPSKIVQYFNDCYQADNREQSLWDIYSKKNEFLKVNTSQELKSLHDNGKLELNQEYGELVQSAITTYRREKTFLYCHHFLTGELVISQGLGGQSKKICAPLVFFDAEIEKLGSKYYLKLDTENPSWNTNLLSLLVESKEYILNLDAAFETGDFHHIDWIATWLKQHNNAKLAINTIDQLTKISELETYKRKASAKQLEIISAGAMLLVKRSQSSRGVIDELTSIAEQPNSSLPLNLLFNQRDKTKFKTKKGDLDNVPGILSEAQSKALKNAAEANFSLLIGPPGTGKSYTIACMVLERFMQGQSVLVVSQNEYAVDVIQEKLIEQLGLSSSAIIRAGAKDYHKYLKRYISDITKGIGLEQPGSTWRRKLKAIKKEIQRSEKIFTAMSKDAVTNGIYLDGVVNGRLSKGIFSRFKLWRQQRRIEIHGHLYVLLNKVQQNQRKREDILSKHINHTYLSALHKVLNKNRKELMKFNNAIRARTSLTQETRFSEIDYSILLQALPIWLCSLSSLHKALPLKKELFDLVIIDEATQCDIASCIPALYRAKRAVVVGDPKQLRHISFLSGQKQIAIQRKYDLQSIELDLNYRDKSMIDFADQAISSQSDVVMLDEHYRSVPSIIDFSNRMFYGGNLRIMTEKPLLHSDPAVEVIQVENAKRIKGVNQAEASAVIARLKTLIEDQRSIPDDYKLTIGVLSFFRDQAEAIQKIIFNEFDLGDITTHKLRAGTPYAFQGEERDIMLISSAIDQDSTGATYRYLNRPDVFNVSITRARDLQLLFISTDVTRLPPDNLLRMFVESIKKQKTHEHTEISTRDKNVEELSEALSQQGMRVLRNYPIAGLVMDLVVMYESHTIAIDIIGFPGEHEDVLHIDRYKIFERAGLRIFPLSYTAWFYEKEKVIDKIKSAFTTLNSSEVDKLSIQQVSSHWVKILAINPEMAKEVRALEFDLVDIRQTVAIDQLGNVIDRYQKLTWVLNQKLNPNELTYSRYLNTAEQVFLGVIDNLKKIVVLSKSISSEALLNDDNELNTKRATIIEDQENAINELIASNNSATISLEEVAVEWSRLDTIDKLSNSSFDEAIKELDRLSKRVADY